MERRKILIVDDLYLESEIIQHYIRNNTDYITYITSDGVSALEILQHQTVDLIITDWHMPEMNGVELIERIRLNEKSKNTFIIIMSGVMTAGLDIKTALETGANEFIRKPVDEIELLARIRSLLTLSDYHKTIIKQNKEIKIQHEELKEREERFRQLVNAASEGIVIFDQYVILDVNDILLSMTGFEREDLIGMKVFDFIQTENNQNFSDNIFPDTEDSFEIKFLKKNLTYFEAEICTKPLYYRKKNTRVTLIRDITEKKEKDRLIDHQRQEMFLKEKELIEKNAEILKNELDYKKRELASNAMFLVNEIEKNNKMIEELESISKQFTGEHAKLIYDIIRKYKINTQNPYWKEFEKHFDQVHQEFYTRLSQKYPELTPNERKLCAFLFLNLSTKEIAAITLQTEKSIDVARSRLRKKFDIDRQDNITTFLYGI